MVKSPFYHPLLTMQGTVPCRCTSCTVPPKSTIDDGLGTAGLSTAGLDTAYNGSHQTTALHQVDKSTEAQHVASLEGHTD